MYSLAVSHYTTHIALRTANFALLPLADEVDRVEGVFLLKRGFDGKAIAFYKSATYNDKSILKDIKRKTSA